MPNVREKKDTLQSQLAETKRMLKAAKRSQKRGCTISPCQWNVAQIITVLRGGEPTAAMTYVQGTCRHKNGAAVASPAIEEKLRVWWRTASQATKRQLINVETADAKKKWAAAKKRRFLAEWNLETWVEDQNVRKGITPMSSLVLQKARNELAIVGIASGETRKGGFPVVAALAPPVWGALEEAATLGHTVGRGTCTEGHGAGGRGSQGVADVGEGLCRLRTRQARGPSSWHTFPRHAFGEATILRRHTFCILSCSENGLHFPLNTVSI